MTMTEDEVDRMFSMGFDCSQIVLAAVSERLGMTKEQALRVASCFGIGMAQEGVCGAASGALMALGLRYGNTVPGDLGTKKELFDIRDEFIRRFREANGDVDCPKLLGQKVHTLEDLITLKPTGLFDDCRGYCVNAIDILEDML